MEEQAFLDEQAFTFKTKSNELQHLIKKKERDQQNVVGIISFCILLFFVFPFGVTNIWFYVNKDSYCNYKDPMSLDIGDWLLINGVSQLVLTITPLTFLIRIDIGLCMTAISMTLYILFGFVWFIIGAIILFRSNIDCINTSSDDDRTMAIYALVMWCYSALIILLNIIKKQQE
jgi:hypothetical protein